ncbi:hypothetical protein HIO71_12375 [Chryseobacterium aquaticum]|uniref:Uncharacterized protein n=1 Tax=Chryseobacterium aquaticum TaxID=452084 RepID=A0A848N941_9FLAO|nr:MULTISPECIES: hypothetical protein [Chryseobacterium]NMR34981.1 hypothetical protein [Chryseobacterium aquaticum]NRQ47155.1 hypothetical protein [Chryseobacterium sp. C-204]
MDKFQKYCLSVILVIIYSNVSANTSISVTLTDCKQLCELYNTLFFENVDGVSEKKTGVNVDYKIFRSTYFELSKYDKALENFEKQSKQNDFAENIYFKSKVAKIRNKDYLDLKKMALKSYDEGKTMKDGYTHHFNKVYRTQIEEL